MKFKMRFADQIVGTLTIVAFIVLAGTIVLLGSKQRWFARDYRFETTFASGSGLAPGMPLMYRGFTIGKLSTIKLNEKNLVNASFVIFDTYYDRVLEGSLVELVVSPIGLGNQFLFHPGNGTKQIAEGSHIPRIDSPEGQWLINSGLAVLQKKDDSISNIIGQINPLLANVNETLEQLNAAFAGTGKGPLNETIQGVADITGGLGRSIDGLLEDISGMTSNLEMLTKEISNPDGLIPRLIDPEGTLFGSIGNSLVSVEQTFASVAGSAAILQTQAPQVARLIEDLRLALVQGQDVLEALKNNPLLKGGVSPHAEPVSSGSGSRNIEF